MFHNLQSDVELLAGLQLKLFTALYADENILYFNEDSGDALLLEG